MTNLQSLIDTIEAAEEGSRELDILIAKTLKLDMGGSLGDWDWRPEDTCQGFRNHSTQRERWCWRALNGVLGKMKMAQHGRVLAGQEFTRQPPQNLPYAPPRYAPSWLDGRGK